MGMEDGLFCLPTPTPTPVVTAVVEADEAITGGDEGSEVIDGVFPPFMPFIATAEDDDSNVDGDSIAVIIIPSFGIFSVMAVGTEEHARREYSGFSNISRS